MSKISVEINYGQQLWTMLEKGSSFKTYDTFLHGHKMKVCFDDFGVHLTIDLEIDPADQLILIACLLPDKEHYFPLDSNLSAEAIPITQNIQGVVIQLARRIDDAFRQTAKGVRLEPWKFKKETYHNLKAPFIYWRLSD